MKKLKCLLAHLLAATALLAAGTSFADDFSNAGHRWREHRPGMHDLRLRREIDARQERQRERIEDARAHGLLSPREYHGLVAGQRGIQRMERDFLADGRLSRFEFDELNRALDAAHHQIRRESRDFAHAPRYDHRPHDYN